MAKSPFGDKCPVMGWETAKLTWERAKSIDLQPVMDIILSMVADYAMGPIANALTNVIQTGTNLMDSATKAVSDLINSLSPSDWLLYALSVNAREIYDVAAREKQLLRSIRHYMKNTLPKQRKGNARYRRLSGVAMANVRNIISALNKASDQMAAYRIINSSFKRAYTMADANCSLLAREMKQYLKKQLAAKTAADMVEKVKTEGWIKSREDLYQGTYNMLASTTNGVIRQNLLDDIAALLDKYMAIARIVYMYGGVSYIPMVLEIKNRYTAVIDKLYKVASPSGDEEAYVINPAESDEVEEMITRLGADVIDIAKKISTEVSAKWAFMLLSMKPDYQIGTKLWGDITEIFPSLDPHYTGTDAGSVKMGNARPPTNGITVGSTSGRAGQSEQARSRPPDSEAQNNKLESLLNASPYSATPSSSLTVYGANMKLPAVIEMYNLVGYAMQAFIKEGSDRDQRISSAPKEGNQRNKQAICEQAEKAGAQLKGDMSKYEFDDAIGLANARLAAADLKGQLTYTERSQVQWQNQVINNDGYFKNIMGAYPLELKIHEPAMSMKVLLEYIVPVALFPFRVSSTLTNDAIEFIDDRMEYLDELMQRVSPLTNYRDEGCEGVIEQLNASGLSFMAKAAAIGQVATGALSVGAAMAGGGMALYDVIQSCMSGAPDPKMLTKIIAGIDNAKKQAESIVNGAADSILKKFDFDLTVVRQYLQLQQKIGQAEGFINEKTSALQQAGGQTPVGELY